MMGKEFDFPRETEFELLCAYVRYPDRFQAIIEPQFFRPAHLDIARIVGENRAKHPKDEISESTLRTLLQQEMHEHRQKDKLAHCRETAHKIFKHQFRYLDTLEGIARRWVTDRRYRKWLIDSEARVNQG